MNTFNFFFGLNLGQRLFSHTDNLSKPLQQTRMSAVSGKRVAGLTKEVLQKMRDDISFKSFYDTVLLKSKNYPSMTEPMLPRRSRAPPEELKLAPVNKHILGPHRTITGGYTLKLFT